mmetsp:Transcript_36687/g.38074  ORF Transcript_36687/g.38074 Transcript_36687/m.38074 type:complete len:617 (-) Transcript_36687:70-1920(-)
MVLSSIKKIDLFGRNLSFEEEDCQAYKTNAGAALSALLFIAVAIITFLFGKEIYERKIPNVMYSAELMDIGRIPLSEFPVIFFFYDSEGKNLEDIYSRLEFKMMYLRFDANKQISYNLYRGMTECNPEHYTKHQDFVETTLQQAKASNFTAYCFNFEPDYVIQNPEVSLNSSTIKLEVNDCNEDLKAAFDHIIKNPHDKFPRCKEPTIKTRVVYTTINYMNSYVDPKDYKNPVKYYPVNEPVPLNEGSAYRLKYALQKSVVQSDIGWILEEKSEEEYVLIDKPTRELFIPFHQKLSFIMDVPLRRNNVIRNYMKVQELFAKVGGLFNALYILCHIILYDYIVFKYRVYYSRFALSEEDYIKAEAERKKKESDLLIEEQGKIGNKFLTKIKKNNFDCNQLNVKDKEESKSQAKAPIKQSNIIRLGTPSRNLEHLDNQAESRDSVSVQMLLFNKQAKKPTLLDTNNHQNSSKIFPNNNLIDKAQLAKVRKDKEEEEIEQPKEVNEVKENGEENNDGAVNNKVLKDNYFTKSRTLDIIKVNSKLIGSQMIESIKMIDQLSYCTYLLNRICRCCLHSETVNGVAQVLTSDKTKQKYSFENYLTLNRKFNTLEGYLKEEAQ